MILLTDEHEILSSNESKIVLTNYRVHMHEKEWGRSYSIFIFLEDISSIEIRYSSNVIFFILAIISALFSILIFSNSNIDSTNEHLLGYGVVATIFFIILYWISNSHVISISSDGGKPLNFQISKMGDDDITDFIYKVSEAKNLRISSLSKN